MKIRVITTVNYPVQINHEIDVEDPDDLDEIYDAVLDLAASIMETSSIDGEMDRDGVKVTKVNNYEDDTN